MLKWPLGKKPREGLKEVCFYMASWLSLPWNAHTHTHTHTHLMTSLYAYISFLPCAYINSAKKDINFSFFKGLEKHFPNRRETIEIEYADQKRSSIKKVSHFFSPFFADRMKEKRSRFVSNLSFFSLRIVVIIMKKPVKRPSSLNSMRKQLFKRT